MGRTTAAPTLYFLMIAAVVACNTTKLGSGNRVVPATTQPKISPPTVVLSLPIGGTQTPFTRATDCTVEDPQIASCDPKTGEIKGLMAGTTNVTVKTADGEHTAIVRVTPADQISGSTTGSATTVGPVATGSGTSESTSGSGEQISVADQQIISQTPGTVVTKVGVNFEDLGANGDHDYNDAVLCFQGHFKVDAARVVSIAAQTVVGSTYSHSGCKHKMKVQITHADGAKEPAVEFDSRAGQPVNMNFKVGSRLEVSMSAYDGGCDKATHGMGEADYARVQPDVCNLDGN